MPLLGFFNSSLLFIIHTPLERTSEQLNASTENISTTVTINPSSPPSSDQTVFASCAHMPQVLVFYLFLQFVNLLLGIPANAAVLCLIWTRNRNRSASRQDAGSSELFTFNLAFLDLMFCLIPPLELVSLVFWSHPRLWLVLRFFYGVKDCSPLLLCCLCVERLLAVRWPLAFAQARSWHRSLAATIVWVVTIVYAILKCLGNIPGFYLAFTVLILAAFALMLFCNVGILWALRTSGQNQRRRAQQRAFQTVLFILGIIIINYLPPVALFPFRESFSPQVFQCYIHYLAFGFMDISSSLQPMLYLGRERPVNGMQSCCCTTENTAQVTTAEQLNTVSQNLPSQ
ncbi:hypothetical protein DNTS_030560 [Danionella cerebrum]|uniref:G-protein coupled receptors family 1 profile domain-containing protein n=1 Tax=Danionella cerebrum TaxID=2873325 RepID=A0A553NWF8_9TELE|nr:hypothetical protein DNTS_030560 [Danionella translucida]